MANRATSAGLFGLLYLAAWAALAIWLVYVATMAGIPLLLAVPAVLLLFVVTNGSLAYALRAAQLRREGKEPPPYFRYVFFPRGVSTTIAVPRAVRILLGALIALGGVFMLAFSGLVLVKGGYSTMPHPIGAVAVGLMLGCIGAAVTYVGFRLIRVRDDQSLFAHRRNK